MSRYLVVAHQTGTSPELLEALDKIAADDPEAAFTVLVPEIIPANLLVYKVGDRRELAKERLEEIRRVMDGRGLRVEHGLVGDDNPILAINDVLQDHPGEFEALVLSTFPEGISRWLGLDIHTKVERKYTLPVIHVIAQPVQPPVQTRKE